MRTIDPVNFDYTGPPGVRGAMCQRARGLLGKLTATLGPLEHGVMSYQYPDGVTIKAIKHYGQYKAIIDVPFGEVDEEKVDDPETVWIVHMTAPIEIPDRANQPGFYITRCDKNLEVILEQKMFPWYKHYNHQNENMVQAYTIPRWIPPYQAFTVGYGKLVYLYYHRMEPVNDLVDNMIARVYGMGDFALEYEFLAPRSRDPSRDETPEYRLYYARMLYQGWMPVGVTCSDRYVGVILRFVGDKLRWYENRVVVDIWSWDGEFIRMIDVNPSHFHLAGSTPIQMPIGNPIGRTSWTAAGRGPNELDNTPAINPDPFLRSILKVELVGDLLYCWTKERLNPNTHEYDTFTNKNQVIAVNMDSEVVWTAKQEGSWILTSQEGNASSDYVIMPQSYQAGPTERSDLGVWSINGEFIQNIHLGEGVISWTESLLPTQWSPDAPSGCAINKDTIYTATKFWGPTPIWSFSGPNGIRIFRNYGDGEGFQLYSEPSVIGEDQFISNILCDRAYI